MSKNENNEWFITFNNDIVEIKKQFQKEKLEKNKIELVLRYHREKCIAQGFNFVRFCDKHMKKMFHDGFDNGLDDIFYFLNDKKLQCVIDNSKLQYNPLEIMKFNVENKNHDIFMFDNTYSKELRFIHSLYIDWINQIESKNKIVRKENITNLVIFLAILKDVYIELFDKIGQAHLNGNVPFLKQLNATIKMC